ncbi:hypothetical protein LEP1GSC041_1730 [Leptospira noguchii str. 2006001870]|nr:hypothetical protein LEP1GSC041_1730 [Leptospira noguchii str. 2006001870]
MSYIHKVKHGLINFLLFCSSDHLKALWFLFFHVFNIFIK